MFSVSCYNDFMKKVALLLFATGIIFSLTSPLSVSAASVFGGKIKAIIPCTCSPGMGIIVGPPKPAILLFVPGLSRLFSNGRLFPGSWTLGDYSSGGVCMQIAGKTCAPYPPIQGTIIKIGTS